MIQQVASSTSKVTPKITNFELMKVIFKINAQFEVGI